MVLVGVGDEDVADGSGTDGAQKAGNMGWVCWSGIDDGQVANPDMVAIRTPMGHECQHSGPVRLKCPSDLDWNSCLGTRHLHFRLLLCKLRLSA